ncbi:MAG: hypothetical protein ABSC47_13355 [Terracidiphilus sp.]
MFIFLESYFCKNFLPVGLQVNRRGVSQMKPAQLATLKFFSLLFLLPGLAGLIISAMISMHYLDTLPKFPAPEELRIIPRNIHGILVYQTQEEDRKLSLIEGSSVGVFVIGLGLGLVYLEKWGSARTSAAEEDDQLAENAG